MSSPFRRWGRTDWVEGSPAVNSMQCLSETYFQQSCVGVTYGHKKTRRGGRVKVV